MLTKRLGAVNCYVWTVILNDTISPPKIIPMFHTYPYWCDYFWNNLMTICIKIDTDVILLLLFELLLAFAFSLANKDFNHVPSPPPRRDSFHFPPTGTDPPAYSSLITLADDVMPETLFTQNERAVLKESFTISSTSSYSYSESETNANPSTSAPPPFQQVDQSTIPNDVSNCSTTSTTNTRIQERKVSSLKITPVTIPDPPAHFNSYLDPQPKSQTSGSPPPPSQPPQKNSTLSESLMQTASAPENQSHLEPQSSNPTVELNAPQSPLLSQTPASLHVEMTKTPPAVPPRPSPAILLVHNWLHTVTTKEKQQWCIYCTYITITQQHCVLLRWHQVC